jgi:predicted nucleotidyltransferase component of viral defense system
MASRFRVEQMVPARRARLHIDSPFGSPTIQARIDITHQLPWRPPERLRAFPIPIHRAYDFTLAETPVITIEELLAEKLARYRRDSLARDLYDLAWFSDRPFDEALVRRLTVLKVWCDVNKTGLGRAPFNPEEILRPRARADFTEEAIGYLTAPVEIDRWIANVRRRYAFLRDVDDVEKLLIAANPRDAYTVDTLIAAYHPTLTP